MRVSADQAAAQSAEPARNDASATSHTRRAPNRSLAQPASGITAVSESR
jgi:hypothetical protein